MKQTENYIRNESSGTLNFAASIESNDNNLNLMFTGYENVNFMIAKFICSKYSKNDKTLFDFIVSLSYIFDIGHIRIAVDEIIPQLEILKLTADNGDENKKEQKLFSTLIAAAENAEKIIKENPNIFAKEEDLDVNFTNSKRTPYIVQENGKYISTEKLYFEEKRFLENFTSYLQRAHNEKQQDDQQSGRNKEKIEATIAATEKKLGITLEEKQKECIQKSFEQKFLIISGGPGTGKTTVVNALLHTHLACDPLLAGNIAVAAPTGKASRRLESVLADLTTSGQIEKPQTIHKLLVSRHYNENNIQTHKIVIIDESSMVDMQLMNKIISRINVESKLILIGDPSQLPAIGTGTFFSDIIENIESPKHLLHKNYVKLEKIKRSLGEINKFAEAVKTANTDILKTFYNSNSAVKIFQPEWEKIFSTAVAQYKKLQENSKTDNYKLLLSALPEFIILSPYSYGQFGTVNINQKLQSYFSKDKNRGLTHSTQNGASHLFTGMPVMITKNDYENMLFNGDRGIVIFENSLHYFILEDAGKNIRKIPFALLKEWEISYAQTVHKSQGNEYETAAIIIDSSNSKLLTKELLYTAVTRAKKEVILFCNSNTIEEISNRKVMRYSSISNYMLSTKNN